MTFAPLLDDQTVNWSEELIIVVKATI